MAENGTNRSMTRQERLDRRRREIVTLLAYPNVGPLPFGAICANLAAVHDQEEVRAVLTALIRDGTVRLAGTTPVPALEGDRAVEREEGLYIVPAR